MRQTRIPHPPTLVTSTARILNNRRIHERIRCSKSALPECTHAFSESFPVVFSIFPIPFKRRIPTFPQSIFFCLASTMVAPFNCEYHTLLHTQRPFAAQRASARRSPIIFNGDIPESKGPSPLECCAPLPYVKGGNMRWPAEITRKFGVEMTLRCPDDREDVIRNNIRNPRPQKQPKRNNKKVPTRCDEFPYFIKLKFVGLQDMK